MRLPKNEPCSQGQSDAWEETRVLKAHVPSNLRRATCVHILLCFGEQLAMMPPEDKVKV